LAKDFDVTLFYYNPNIYSGVEFLRRAEELEKLEELGLDFKVEIEEWRPEEYDAAVKGFEDLGEGSERCFKCYELRMRRTAEEAVKEGYGFFTTTLSVSRYKKTDWVHEIGRKLEEEFGVGYLEEDFKKRNGYGRSVELSQELGIYRQEYCGCRYSKVEAEDRRKKESPLSGA